MPSDHRVADSDVVFDVELENGLFFFVVANLGGGGAHSVRVRFDEPVRGLGGERRFDRLGLFRRLEFLPAGRRIRVFFDRAGLFFAREEPRALGVTVTWRTDAGERRTRAIRHDLDAYRDFPYLEVPRDA